MTRHGHPLRFIEQTVANPTNDCVIWPYAKSKGYGNVWIDGHAIHAHRHALVLATGIDPPDLVAAHGPCHDRLCINPQHSSWKTEVENQHDKRRDGTVRRGSDHGRAVLTEADVVEIRRRCLAGETHRNVATSFGISRGHVGNIVNGRFWRPQPVNNL